MILEAALIRLAQQLLSWSLWFFSLAGLASSFYYFLGRLPWVP